MGKQLMTAGQLRAAAGVPDAHPAGGTFDDGYRAGYEAAMDVKRRTREAGEPTSWDEAVQMVHRAFCDPEHELVGDWDSEMADALRRNGFALIRREDAETLRATAGPPYERPMRNDNLRDGDGFDAP